MLWNKLESSSGTFLWAEKHFFFPSLSTATVPLSMAISIQHLTETSHMQPQLASVDRWSPAFCFGFIVMAQRHFDEETLLLPPHISIMLHVLAPLLESDTKWICPTGNIFYPNYIECSFLLYPVAPIESKGEMIMFMLTEGSINGSSFSYSFSKLFILNLFSPPHYIILSLPH